MELIEKEKAVDAIYDAFPECRNKAMAESALLDVPVVDALPIPTGGVGDVTDGYHTFNGLYYQRKILFAALVRSYKERAWKSHKHEDGELCFGGGWFIVGVDTPEGSYTYHYEDKDWSLFECDEVPLAKHWDGHTEKDVTRLLSLPVKAKQKRGFWIDLDSCMTVCSECNSLGCASRYCPNCGSAMEKT